MRERIERVQAIALPEDVTISATPRAGTEHRAVCVRYLERMHREGYLSDEQLTARVRAAARANTDQMLTELLADLPAPPKPLLPAFNWDRRECYVPILLGTITGGALLAVVPYVALESQGDLSSGGLGPAIVAVTVIMGLIIVLTSAITICYKISQED